MGNSGMTQAQLLALIEQIPLGVIAFEVEDIDDRKSLRIKMVNKSASVATGIDMEQFLGMTLFEAFPRSL